MFTKIKKFLKEARQEIKKVNWPSRKETTRYTFFVILISLIVALYLGLLDYMFTNILKLIV